MPNDYKLTAVIWLKELKDALRDRKTLLSMLAPAILMGPLFLVGLSFVFAQQEKSAEQRVVYVLNAKEGASVLNFFERQSFQIKTPPADFESQIKSGQFTSPVLVVPDQFDQNLAAGEEAQLELVYASNNRGAAAGAGTVRRLVSEFGRERSTYVVAMAGVTRQQRAPVDMRDKDLTNTQAKQGNFMTGLSSFIFLAILIGALNAAVDTTAGERERGSLEPLLMNPASPTTVIVGKWAAVACLATLSATLAVLSFFPAQWLIQTESLKAMFNFGWREAMGLLTILLPLGGAASAMFMAVSMRCKTFKEANANSQVINLVFGMLPLITLFDQEPERSMYLWIPALGQQMAMNRVMRNESLPLDLVLIPACVCILITLTCIVYMRQRLRKTVTQ
jgi:sodium transport system permease protein